MWWRLYPLYALCLVLLILAGPPTWLWIGIEFSVLMVIESQTWLTMKIRRLERDGRGDSPAD